MFDRSVTHESVSEFNGPVLLVDSADVAPERGLLARNVSYIDGQVKTRLGYTHIFAVNEAVTGMCNWQGAPPGNTLTWFRSSDSKIRQGLVSAMSNSTLSSVALTGAHSAIMVPASTRMYATGFTTANRGVTSGNRVFSYQSSAFVDDSAFLGPVSFGGSGITEPSTGVITAGTHRFGFAIEYRTGFRTRLSPDNSGSGNVSLSTFVPYSFTAAGAKNMTWTITPSSTWPTAAVRVHVAMTTADNTAEYFFVPGANVAVTGGSGTAAAITFSISDEDLVAYATPATEYLYYLTQNTNGTDRFKAFHFSFYGDRGVWLTTQPDEVGNERCCAFVSNVGQYQQVTLDQHLVQLPGGIDINCAFTLGQNLYLVGPTWTYVTNDNGSNPVTWPTPHLVDGRRGTLAIRGVEVSPTGDYAWVADQTGLYLFNGSYPDLPTSYWQTPDWDRINWAYAYTIQMKDIPAKRKVEILVPLDGATSPSHKMAFYYEHGKRFDQIRYSLDDLLGYGLGAFELVKNTVSGAAANVVQKSDIWTAPSNADYMLREIYLATETNPYQDNLNPVRGVFQTGLFPKGFGGALYRHQGGIARLRGTGGVQQTFYGLDNVRGQAMVTIPLTTSPGVEYSRECSLMSEGASVKVDGDLIPEPEFEFGGQYWTAGAASWTVANDSTNARNGNYVAKRTGNAVDSDLSNGQRITIGAAVSLYLEMWAKTSSSGTNGAIYLKTAFYDSTGSLISTLSINTTGNSTTYTRFSGIVTTPANTVYMLVRLTGVSQTTGIWYVDDLLAQQVGANWVWSNQTNYFSQWATRRGNL